MNLGKTCVNVGGGWFFALFVLSVVFFFAQHMSGLSWDFTVYSLNARYIFGGGNYFEWERAPLVPSMIFAFSFLGWRGAEYAYMLFVCVLFAFACDRFSKRYEVNALVFYTVMLNSFVVTFGFLAGTELLTLSLLMLAITYLRSGCSGLFIGFAVAARYLAAPYLLLLLFKRDTRQIILALTVVVLLFTPWFAYNYLMKGDPLTSIKSSYLMNIASRESGFKGPTTSDLAKNLLILFTIAVFGALLSVKRRFREVDAVMFVFAFVTLASFWMTHVRELRYLFNLALPVGFYCAQAIEGITCGRRERIILAVILLSLMNYTATSAMISLVNPAGLYEGVNLVGGGCMVMSNAWPYLNYLGVTAKPHPDGEYLDYLVGEGNRVVLFKSGDIPNPDYLFDAELREGVPVMYEDDNILVLGNEFFCAKKEVVDRAYSEY